MQRLILGLIAIAMVATGVWMGRQRVLPVEVASNSLVNTFYMQSVVNTQGKDVSLSYWKGRLVLVNFWSASCKPCLEEMPELDLLSKEWQGEVEIIGISIDELDTMKSFLKKLPVSYANFSAGLGGLEFAKQLGSPSDSIPYSVIIDASGNVIWQKLGRVDIGVLRDWKKQLTESVSS